MTSVLPIDAARAAGGRAASYRHAHFYFLAVLVVTVAGFWPSFFRNPGAADFWHMLHGTTATLWVVALVVQSWFMSRGLVRWHRRVAVAALVLLPMLVVSALYLTGVMQNNAQFPLAGRSFIAFIDFASIGFLVLLVVLALRNVSTPAAHKRFMAATVLIGLPPALTRLYGRVLFPDVPGPAAFHASLVTVHLILIALIVGDRLAGERRLAYPLSLVFFVSVHLVIGPVSASEPWRAAMAWYGSLFAR